jgi:hypothetical protein
MGFVGEDADDLGAPLDLADRPFDGIGGVQRWRGAGPGSSCRRARRSRPCHGDLWNLGPELVGDAAPLLLCLLGVVLGQGGGDEGRDRPSRPASPSSGPDGRCAAPGGSGSSRHAPPSPARRLSPRATAGPSLGRSSVVSLVKSWSSQPNPNPVVVGDRRKAASALVDSALARGLAPPVTPSHGTRTRRAVEANR